MEEFVTYVLHSERRNKIYIGYTSNLVFRFHSHNKFSSKGYTRKFRPWIVILVEFYPSKSKAIQRERFLKSGIGRKYIGDTILPKYK